MQAAAVRRRRSPLIVTAGILAVLAALVLAVASFWTEKLWFDSVGFTGVFTTQLLTEVLLFSVGFLVMGGSVALSMATAFRLRPQARRQGASAILDRYRDLLEANIRAALAVPTIILGGMAGLSAAAQVLPVLAWMHRTPTGKVDSRFGLDISFYLFEYPVWRLVTSMILSALVFGLIAAVTVHFAVGNLASGRAKPRNAPPAPVARHLSVMAALILIVYGLENLLDTYGLMLAQGPLFDGLQYTDDHARLTAKIVIAVIAFLVAALFFVNAFVNRILIPVVGVALMVVSGLILALIYPAVVQAFTVKPNEPDKERSYVANHIAATRDAFDIADVKIEDYSAVTNVSSGQLNQDAATLPGIRLMDPNVIPDTFEQLQQVRGYYAFPASLDVDRYQIDGKETDVVVAARELNQNNIPDKNWNNIHTVYTHGYGFVSAYGNQRQTNGEPVWITRDIPPVGKITETESQVYFGESSDTFAIVGRNQGEAPLELDTPGGGQGGGERYNTYAGLGGVPIGNFLMRALYSVHFSDLNILLSDRVNSSSKILYDRTPVERVQKVAPWLTADSNTYPAIVDGRLVWIVDAYTTSSTYPNSQQISLSGAISDSTTAVAAGQPDTQVNYMRNSVKAVVDAYDGSVNLYAWDESDPILRAYEAAFPGTVKPKAEIGQDLLSHLRYPEDYFKVQRQMLGRYHMTNPDSWYQQSDLWEIPSDPVQTNSTRKEPPYYLSIRWPGDTVPVFSATSVFVPRLRQNLGAYLAVNADAASADYGQLRVLRMSDTHQIDGPGQTFNAITTDTKVAQVLRNYTSQGSAEVRYGNLLTLPVGGGLLYVQPIFTVRAGSAGAYPALTYVVVRFGQHVGLGTTLQAALDEVFQGNAGASTGELPAGTKPTPSATPSAGGTTAPTTPSTPTGTVDQAATTAALDKAQAAFTAADAALKSGDLAGYQAKITEARAELAAALKAMGR